MRIGIVRYWAGRPAAEHEVIARLRAAAVARGHQLVELNPDGSALWAPDRVPPVDWILNLHFASPKARDVPHVGALWNPLDFHHLFGFTPHFANQLTFDYLASCGSRVVDDAIALFRPDLFGTGLPQLNHTVPARYLVPERRDDRLLSYIGVNWERVGGQAVRHGDLLTMLDAAGITRIHGPEEVGDIAPWEGYGTYRGPLPFDGWSVIAAIAAAGAALIVSSPAHYRSGLMSSRPFESAAAGVPMISERHPFMLEHFASAALFFDERAPADEQALEISDILDTLNRDPDRAVELAGAAQEILRTSFSLDDQLDRLCAWVTVQEELRRAAADDRRVAVTAIVVPTGDESQTQLWALRNQEALAAFARVLLVPRSGGPSWDAVARLIGPAAQVVVPTRPDLSWSQRAGAAASGIEGAVCFLTGFEALYGDYALEVGESASTRQTMIIPCTMQPQAPDTAANARLPHLLCGRTAPWHAQAVASVVTTGSRLRALQAILGPGCHLGILAQEGLEADDAEPRFQPWFSVPQSDHDRWNLGAVAGEEEGQDASYARIAPAAVAKALPWKSLRRNANVATPAPAPIADPGANEEPLLAQVLHQLAMTLENSSLPRPVTRSLISAGRSVMFPKGRRRR